MRLCNFYMLMLVAFLMPQFSTIAPFAVKENSKRRDEGESGISPSWVALDININDWPDEETSASTQETILQKPVSPSSFAEDNAKAAPPERKRLRCKSTKNCVSFCHRNNCNRNAPQQQTEVDSAVSIFNRTDDVKLISVLGDENVDFLNGESHHKRCMVRTESYPGLTIADAINRLKEFEGTQPNLLIVHVGANDIVIAVGSSPGMVVQRLKELVDYLRELKDNSRLLKIAVSGILPRADDASLFNKKANDINNVVRTYAQRNGLWYINHFEDFWKSERFSADLYDVDGKLNERGMDVMAHSLLENEFCKRESRIGHRRKSSLLELKDILPLDRKMYDKHLPPKYEGKATKVYFHVTVLSVDSIDEESMTYVADIFLAQSWKDFRLRLPENMTEDYRILDVDWLKYIWRPDSFFKNAKSVTFHEMSVPNHYLWLYYDKTLLYMAKLTLEMSCAMKFQFYPHDTQLCSMMIESLSHTTDDLIFLWNVTDPLVVNPDIELPQLDIIQNTTEDCTLEYSTGNFTCLAVVFNLKRRVGYHLFHTYIPTTLIVVMSWISFWIRPEAIPARVTLGVTSLLTLATQNTQSQSALPPVSYVKAIDVWMSSCTVFVFLSLMEFAIVNHYMGHKEAKAAKKLAMSSAEENDNKIHTNKGNGSLPKANINLVAIKNSKKRCCHLDVAMTIDKFSRIFFPSSFCVLNAIYWVTYAIQG